MQNDIRIATRLALRISSKFLCLGAVNVVVVTVRYFLREIPN